LYPRDVWLARVLAMTLCLCLSQVGVLSKRLEGSRCFGVEASFDLSYIVYKEIRVATKIRVGLLPSGTFLLNSGLEKFRHGISIAEMCYQLIT